VANTTETLFDVNIFQGIVTSLGSKCMLGTGMRTLFMIDGSNQWKSSDMQFDQKENTVVYPLLQYSQ
jgi:hypothetical protein